MNKRVQNTIAPKAEPIKQVEVTVTVPTLEPLAEKKRTAQPENVSTEDMVSQSVERPKDGPGIIYSPFFGGA
jgi:hypothetical protein